MAETMIARRRRGKAPEQLTAAALALGLLDAEGLAEMASALESGFDAGACDGAACDTVAELARQGLVEFTSPDGGDSVVLVPCRRDFSLAWGAAPAGLWKLSRLTCVQLEDGALAARNPLADCMLRMDGAAGALLLAFDRPRDSGSPPPPGLGDARNSALLALFARARLILPADGDGRTVDEVEPAARQWSFHELLFHSLSRMGRTEKPFGATYAFQGAVAQQPALKAVPAEWLRDVVDLPRPDLAALAADDLSLTAAIEQRRSVREHSVVPPNKAQLGEFLFRTARVRTVFEADHGPIATRPYPGGGACYEIEVYATVEACTGVPRGFYYYDPLRHRLCLISRPDSNMAAILLEASMATARQGRPQILLTLASRFHRVQWKYSSMGYAAQLKHIGVIYQTMYLVATAMNLAGCALGAGNTDRFCEMTGLDYLEEGSIGEFMLGRPL